MPPRESLSRHALPLGVILAAVLLTYANSLLNGFVWDDHVLIEGSAFLSDPANARHLLDPRYYTSGHAVTAGTRPVFLLSLLADRALWGPNAGGYHLSSVLLHAANSGLVYLLASLLVSAGPAALLAGLLFGLHPVATEAVNAISFRADPLAAFFVLTGLLAYLRARVAPPGRVAALLGLSAALYLLGLLSKEMAATLPALAALAEACFPSAPARGRRLRLAAALYGAVAVLFAAFWAPRFRYANIPPAASGLRAAVDEAAARFLPTTQPGPLPLSAPHQGRVFAPSSTAWSELYADRGVWFWTTAGTARLYFSLLAFPARLLADRAPRLATGPLDHGAALSALLVALVALSAWLLRTRLPLAGFGLAWCLVSLLPVSGVIPLANPVAERYLYLVAPGFAMAAAAALGALHARARLRTGVVATTALLLFAMSARTVLRNKDWRTDASLFLSIPPDAALSPRARFTRAMILDGQGRGDEAARELREALLAHPGFAEAWLELGALRARSGAPDEALAYLEKAVSLSPRAPVMRFALAQHLAQHGEPARAAEQYETAVALEPRYFEAWVNLAALDRDRGYFERSRARYERAISLVSDDPVPYYSYGLLLEKMGLRREARRLHNLALRHDPSYGPAQAALARLGGSSR